MEREISLTILNKIIKNNAYSNLSINEELKKTEKIDEAFIRQLIYGVLENRIYLDYFISYFLNSPIEKVKLNSLNILRLAVYQIIFMNSVPDYAAVNEAVNLAKKTSKGQTAFINGVLRNVLRKKENVKLPDEKKYPLERLSVEYSVQPWMVKHFAESYGTDFARKFFEAANKVPPMTIRVNTLKTSAEKLKEALEKQDFDVKDGYNSKNALIIQGGKLLATEEYKNGEFSVQDESSMLAVEALNPEPDDVLLDLCAAPGGKTIYAGELMNNKGKIIACDLYEKKLSIVDRNAKKHGIDIIQCLKWDAQKFNSNFKGIANKVICDVPCSGLGVIRRKPEIKYTKTKDDILQLSNIQYKILENAANYVISGGTLLYSTCTVSLDENEKLIERFLENVGKNLFAVDKMHQLTPFKEATDGFFICKLIKT